MCYYVASKLSGEEIYQLEHDFVVKWQEEESAPQFFVANGFGNPKLPLITSERNFTRYNWGLIPNWVKDWATAQKTRTQTLNAILEEVDSKPSYRGAIKAGRFCVIPVNGFYEWHHHVNQEKYPHFIYPTNYSLFYLAGIWETWTNPGLDEQHNTFSICTKPANERMEWIHNSKKRMPAILLKGDVEMWLDPKYPFDKKKEKVLEPFSGKLMGDHPVSRLISSRKDNPNQRSVMEPFVYPELAPDLFS